VGACGKDIEERDGCPSSVHNIDLTQFDDYGSGAAPHSDSRPRSLGCHRVLSWAGVATVRRLEADIPRWRAAGRRRGSAISTVIIMSAQPVGEAPRQETPRGDGSLTGIDYSRGRLIPRDRLRRHSVRRWGRGRRRGLGRRRRRRLGGRRFFERRRLFQRRRGFGLLGRLLRLRSLD
jgi:hypothetical protein